jgi:hypothetical protein
MRATFNVIMRIVSTLLGVGLMAMGTVWILHLEQYAPDQELTVCQSGSSCMTRSIDGTLVR